MPYSLPVNGDGILVPFTDSQIEAMDIRRRGAGDGSHVRYNFGPDGSGCVRRFSCAWAEQFNTLLYFVGAVVSYNDPDTGVRKLSRLLPLIDPDYGNWICTKVEFEPFQFTGQVDEPVEGTEPYPEYTRCDFTATFELVPYNIATDEAVAESPLREQIRYVTAPGYPGADVSADASYIGLPGGVLQFTTTDGTSRPAGVPIPYPVGFVEGKTKFKVIWRRVPQNVWGPATALTQLLIGTETTRGYIGSINLTTFMGYSPLSLQLIGIEQRLLPDPAGLGYSWDLTYSFEQAIKPFGHLGTYFHDTLASGSASGYYETLRPAAGMTTKTDPTTIGPNDALLPVNEFANLFFPGIPW